MRIPIESDNLLALRVNHLRQALFPGLLQNQFLFHRHSQFRIITGFPCSFRLLLKFLLPELLLLHGKQMVPQAAHIGQRAVHRVRMNLVRRQECPLPVHQIPILKIACLRQALAAQGQARRLFFDPVADGFPDPVALQGIFGSALYQRQQAVPVQFLCRREHRRDAVVGIGRFFHSLPESLTLCGYLRQKRLGI